MRLTPGGFGAVTVAGLSIVILGPHAPAEVGTLRDSNFDSALAALSSLVLLALSAWIVSSVGLAFLAARTGVALRLSRAITPAFLRRALFLGAAGALAVGPVSASVTTGNTDGHGSRSVSQTLDGLPLPDRPMSQRPISIAVTTGTYTVKSGDTLWAIASRDLDPTTSPNIVAAEMKRWYATNRSVIGPDPNLILPGQKLTQPTKDSR